MFRATNAARAMAAPAMPRWVELNILTARHMAKDVSMLAPWGVPGGLLAGMWIGPALTDDFKRELGLPVAAAGAPAEGVQKFSQEEIGGPVTGEKDIARPAAWAPVGSAFSFSQAEIGSMPEGESDE